MDSCIQIVSTQTHGPWMSSHELLCIEETVCACMREICIEGTLCACMREISIEGVLCACMREIRFEGALCACTREISIERVLCACMCEMGSRTKLPATCIAVLRARRGSQVKNCVLQLERRRTGHQVRRGGKEYAGTDCAPLYGKCL